MLCRYTEGSKKKKTLELIERAQKGDLDAYSELVAMFQEVIFKLCCSYFYTDRFADAEEAAMNAFFNIYRYYIKPGKKIKDFEGLLYKIAINECKTIGEKGQYIRKNGKKIKITKIDYDEYKKDVFKEALPEAFVVNSLDQDCIEKEEAYDKVIKDKERARSAIKIKDNLPDKYREPLDHYLNGEKIKDIAKKLKQGESATKNQIYRALEKIRKDMKGQDFI